MATPNQALNEYRNAIQALKRVLKERKITYRQLGSEIGMTESGIKKIFAAKDGSFQRLVEICRVVGVSIVEIIDDGKIKSVTYSNEQQAAFLKDPDLFFLYWCLVYERRTFENAKEALGLSEERAFKLARTLDVLKLIRLLPENKIRIPSIKAIRWEGDGEFTQKIYRSWSKNLINSFTKPVSSENEFFQVRYMQMKKSTYQEFLSALKALEEEFVRRSIYEMRTSPGSLNHVRWLVASDNRSFVESNKQSL